MSRQYASLLSQLLSSDHASVNLQAAICRQIVAAKDLEQGGVLVIGLISVLRQGGLFLSTYATAALVNLATKDVVKNYIMRGGNELLLLQQLESKDDDLTLYTLMLLVNITKAGLHRRALVSRGIVPVIYKILSMNYAQLQYKRRVLTELCSVLGQLCNDEETRKALCQSYQYVLDCLLQIFDDAEGATDERRRPGETLDPGSSKIISKVLFALKQLCANSLENKDLVGSRVAKAVVQDLQNPANLEHRDWATNAILLLLLLAISHTNCSLLLAAGWSETYQVLTSSPLGKMDATRDRIQQIDFRIDTLIKAGVGENI